MLRRSLRYHAAAVAAGAGGCASSKAPPTVGIISSSLRHPRDFDSNNANSLEFRSPEWRAAMAHLYRSVLKAHEMLIHNDQMREFGDKFVKAEFRRHAVANAKYASIFYKGWYEYVVQLEHGMGETGRALTPQEQALLSGEQKERMTDLRSHVIQRRFEDGTANLTELETSNKGR